MSDDVDMESAVIYNISYDEDVEIVLTQAGLPLLSETNRPSILQIINRCIGHYWSLSFLARNMTPPEGKSEQRQWPCSQSQSQIPIELMLYCLTW